jgi:hypothetical protein
MARSAKNPDEAAGQSPPRSRRPGGLPRHGQGLAGADECDISRPCASSRQTARAARVLRIEDDSEQKATRLVKRIAFSESSAEGKQNGGVRFPERGNHGTIQWRLTHRRWPHGSDLID